jgi:hypothetical protein
MNVCPSSVPEVKSNEVYHRRLYIGRIVVSQKPKGASSNGDFIGRNLSQGISLPTPSTKAKRDKCSSRPTLSYSIPECATMYLVGYRDPRVRWPSVATGFNTVDQGPNEGLGTLTKPSGDLS